MTLDEMREMSKANEEYVHDRINSAYRAGVRHCIDLLKKADTEPHSISRFTLTELYKNLELKLTTLYV